MELSNPLPLLSRFPFSETYLNAFRIQYFVSSYFVFLSLRNFSANILKISSAPIPTSLNLFAYRYKRSSRNWECYTKNSIIFLTSSKLTLWRVVDLLSWGVAMEAAAILYTRESESKAYHTAGSQLGIFPKLLPPSLVPV